MLILTRRSGESLLIGDNIKISILNIKGNQVRIGVVAPRDVTVQRQEITAENIDIVSDSEETEKKSTDMDQINTCTENTKKSEDKPKKNIRVKRIYSHNLHDR